MKLFASDFDGTLYFGHLNRSIYNQNVKKIKEFQKENHFAVVTGRSQYSILKTLNLSSIKPNYCASFNGGYIIDQHGNCLYEDKLTIDVKMIEEYALKSNCKDILIDGLNQCYVKSSKFSIKNKLFELYHCHGKVKNIEDLDKNDIYIISILCESESKALLLAKQIKEMKLNCSVYSNKDCIDIVGRNASKQHAVEIIQDCYDYEKTYVIGDSYNDVCMIKEFDGFTVNSANEEIKKIASKVFNSVSEALEMIMRQK